jgi:hypothetical protein
MLGEGKTTKETAAALFLSPKTVEYHLRHVYHKLGIGSRAELSAAMAAHCGLRSACGQRRDRHGTVAADVSAQAGRAGWSGFPTNCHNVPRGG